MLMKAYDKEYKTLSLWHVARRAKGSVQGT